MPSMSYCQFENTSADLGQCIDTINDAYETGRGTPRHVADKLDLNEYEIRAFHRLKDQCEEFLSQYADLAKYIK